MDAWTYLLAMVFLGIVLVIKRKKIKIEPIIAIPLKGRWERFGVEIEKDENGVKIKKRVFPILFVVLYRTKIGIKFIDKLVGPQSRFRILKNVLKIIGYASIGLCCLVVVATAGFLIYYLWIKFTAESVVSTAGVVMVLPFKVKGQIYVPLTYWIISIFIIAVVHEFGHAVLARLNNVPINYTGPAFLSFFVPLIPAAFVEPNEPIMKCSEKKKQLSIMAAGPTFNVVLGAICFFVLVFLLMPLTNNIVESKGMEIVGIENPALIESGLQEGQVIDRAIGSEGRVTHILIRNDLYAFLTEYKPGETVQLCEKDACYSVILQDNPIVPGSAYLGISSNEKLETIDGAYSSAVLLWLRGLFIWLALLNIGVGSFNMLPVLPIVDGGQMVGVLTKDAKYGKCVFASVVVLFICLLILTVV